MLVSVVAGKNDLADIWASYKGLSSPEMPSCLSAPIQKRHLEEVIVVQGLPHSTADNGFPH